MLWNEGARRLYGYDADEIIGSNMAVLHADEDREKGLPEAMSTAALEHGSWEGTVRRRRKDGSEFIARAVLTPRNDAGRNPTGFLLISSDISDEVRLRQDLEEAETYSRQLLEFAPDAIIGIGPDGSIKLTNSQVETLFGYTREELRDQPIEVLVPDRFRKGHRGHRERYFQTPKTRPMGAGLDLYALRKDGSEFPCEISLSSIGEGGEITAVAAVRDVSERKRIEEELRRTNAELERAADSKDRFLANMSHELRTPLNAVLGFTGTLLMEMPGKLNTEQRQQLETIQSNGRHLLSLINDLLDVAKIESGKVEIHLESVDGADVVRQVSKALRPLAERKGLAFELAMPEGPLTLRSDRRALSQILINLLNNAIKFTEEGEVRLEVSQNSDGGSGLTRFRVIDTGIGIDASEQQRLFGQFEQSRTAAAAAQGGTGLGLYISRNLASLLGGELTLESGPGAGSTFTLELPE